MGSEMCIRDRDKIVPSPRVFCGIKDAVRSPLPTSSLMAKSTSLVITDVKSKLLIAVQLRLKVVSAHWLRV